MELTRARMIVVGVALTLAVVLAGLLSVSAPLAAHALVKPLVPAEQPDTVQDASSILDVGETIRYADWTVTVAPVKWHQNKAVEEATFVPAPLAGGAQWALAEVTITNTADEPRSASFIQVRLDTQPGNPHGTGIPHTAHHSFYPRQTLPGELDIRDIAPGQSRTGTIGWAVPTDADERPCELVVQIAHNAFDDQPLTQRVRCG